MVAVRSHEVRHAPHLACNEFSVQFSNQILDHVPCVGCGDTRMQGGSLSQVLEVGGFFC